MKNKIKIMLVLLAIVSLFTIYESKKYYNNSLIDNSINLGDESIKKTNPMTVTEKQNLTVNYSANKQTKSFTGAKNVQGEITYIVKSQKNSSNKTVNYFSIPSDKKASIEINSKTPAGAYTVIVNANTEGNDNYEELTKSITLTITVQVSVEKVKLNKTSVTLVEGKGTTLTATVSPSNATNKNVTWSTSNKNVVTVSKGVIKGIKAGTATITVTTKDGNKKATCKVTVKKKNTITVTSKQKLVIDETPIKTNVSTSSKTYKFEGATKAQGAITYSIKSQTNSSNKTVNYFSIPKNTKNQLNVKDNTPGGVYTVVITAAAKGNNSYANGSKDIKITVTVKKVNPITVTAKQSLTVNYSTSAVTKSFTKATKAQGTVTYSIKSQKNSKTNKTVKYFSIPSSTKANIKMKANVPVGTYKVVITAAAKGNNSYSKGSKDITLTIKVNTVSNPITVKTEQSWNANYSTSAQTKEFKEATKAQGKVTYSIHSQNCKVEGKNCFSIPNTGKAKLSMNAKTPAGTYTVSIYAKAAGNSNYKSGTREITMTVTVNYDITNYVPSGFSVDNAKSYSSNTLKYKVLTNSRGKYTDGAYAIIWVKDAYNQLNNGNSNYTSKPSREHFNNEITKYSYQKKGMIGTNGGFSYNGKDNIPILYTRGNYTKNTSYQTYKCANSDCSKHTTLRYSILTFSKDNKLIITDVKGEYLVDAGKKSEILSESGYNTIYNWLKDNGARNTWGAGYFITSGWSDATGGEDYRTTLCQVDEHNFVLAVGKANINAGQKYLHDVFGCTVTVNLDGGGSSGMYYKNSSMNEIGAIKQYLRSNEKYPRSVSDILYFAEQ